VRSRKRITSVKAKKKKKRRPSFLESERKTRRKSTKGLKGQDEVSSSLWQRNGGLAGFTHSSARTIVVSST
jgi:hypothetical protein